jgi:hypothetical protein
MRWAVNAECVVEMRSAYRGKIKIIDHLEDLDGDRTIILKWILKT